MEKKRYQVYIGNDFFKEETGIMDSPVRGTELVLDFDLDTFARITAGGPCICRQYQTGPDGISKCIKWSRPGCGDAPFYVAPADRTIDYISAPATTVDVTGGGTGRGTTPTTTDTTSYENNPDDTRRREEGRNPDTPSGY